MREVIRLSLTTHTPRKNPNKGKLRPQRSFSAAPVDEIAVKQRGATEAYSKYAALRCERASKDEAVDPQDRRRGEQLRLSFIALFIIAVGCSSFKAERVGRDESDEKALSITDEWVMRDTENAVAGILKQIEKHRGFRRYLKALARSPKVFVADVQNRTSEPYFPVDDLNDELLNEFSSSGDYILIDESVRSKILQEIRYQNDGMVAADQAKSIGTQAGADLMIFGAIRMSPKSRKGRTIKEYSVNIRMTDIAAGVEVMRTRVKVNKYSKKGRIGW